MSFICSRPSPPSFIICYSLSFFFSFSFNLLVDIKKRNKMFRPPRQWPMTDIPMWWTQRLIILHFLAWPGLSELDYFYWRFWLDWTRFFHFSLTTTCFWRPCFLFHIYAKSDEKVGRTELGRQVGMVGRQGMLFVYLISLSTSSYLVAKCREPSQTGTLDSRRLFVFIFFFDHHLINVSPVDIVWVKVKLNESQFDR